VWFAPLVVHLGYRGFVAGSRMAVAAVWLLCALIGGWIFTTAGDSPQAGILSLRPPGMWGQFWPGAYVFVFAAVLLGTAVGLVRPGSAGLTRHDLEYVERVDAGHH
jgi:alpha-1,2-mannosyltransferase